MPEPASYWRYELEDMSVIGKLTEPSFACEFASNPFGRPDAVLPEKDFKIEDQGAMGSCAGNSLSSCVEQQHMHESGEYVQLSRIYAYLRAQEFDGLIGRDQGSTISSGVKVASTEGIPPESLAEYPNPVKYPNSKSRQSILKQSNRLAGKPFRIRSTMNCESHEDYLNKVGGGVSFHMGMSWPPRFETRKGIKTVVDVGNSGGGHAICGLWYRENGNPIFANSHGYLMDFTPEAFTKVLRMKWTVCIGLSGMANPAPRDLSYLKQSRKKRLGNVQELWS